MNKKFGYYYENKRDVVDTLVETDKWLTQFKEKVPKKEELLVHWYKSMVSGSDGIHNLVKLVLAKIREDEASGQAPPPRPRVREEREFPSSSRDFVTNVVELCDSKAMIPKSTLYNHYAEWCAVTKAEVEPRRRFNKAVEKIAGAVEIQHGPKRTKTWIGISVPGH